MKQAGFEVLADRVTVGEDLFSVSFQRTLRIPDDGKIYPLPPGLGVFQVRKAAEYAGKVPAGWDLDCGVFIPLYQREALWLSFQAPGWRPVAAKVGAGKINALTGERLSKGLQDSPQDYLVCPNQPWLDGFKTESGVVRQFVAMPLGQGYTISEQLAGPELSGGLVIHVYPPRPGRFPDKPPKGSDLPRGVAFAAPGAAVQEMGLAAGGKIEQKVYPDPYGFETWDEKNPVTVKVYIVNSLQYAEITGEPPPATPVDARLYTRLGFPWFSLYDEDLSALPGSEQLAGAGTAGQIDREKTGAADQADSSIEIEKEQIQPIQKNRKRKR